MATSKKKMLEMLQQIKSGKLTIDQVSQSLETSRKVEMNAEDIQPARGMVEAKAYFVQNGKLFSLPLSKKRNDGRTASFVPYYRTEGKKKEAVKQG